MDPSLRGSDYLLILLEEYVARYYAQSYARYHELCKLQLTGLKSNPIYSNTVCENVSEIPNKL